MSAPKITDTVKIETAAVTEDSYEVNAAEVALDTTGKAKKHNLTQDKSMRRIGSLFFFFKSVCLCVRASAHFSIAAVIIFLLLICSWTAQWVAFAIPYWRGDQYHVGGLFEICGDRDFIFNNVTNRIYPTIKTNWTCQPFADYVDNFQQLFAAQPDSDWYIQSGAAKKMIVVSRWFEALTTSMDMIFGVTTIWAVVYPHVDFAQQKKNMIFALIGIILTPSFAVIDSFIQNSYWASIGVGIFNTNVQTFLYASGDISWISSAIDFALQAGFLIWGVRRHYLRHQAGDTSIAIV
ncbi:hypothetical protein HK100_012806 [Physocladia obscura]|uniref:Uncharacterized protein n=1 Tax=Physocladia obscura TaxID=109957 RepID=A0AAD5T0Z8_9FUNG|nr:hypothetical protein HK100_012806 [Physocladia obscura]